MADKGIPRNRCNVSEESGLLGGPDGMGEVKAKLAEMSPHFPLS
jgi:hypothetical protein